MTVVRVNAQTRVRDEWLDLLRPYLLGEQPREDGEWDMYCPLHQDSNRSAQLNVENGAWFCHAGCGGGPVRTLVAKRDEWIPPSHSSGGSLNTARKAGRKEALSDSKVAGWSAALLSDEPILNDLLVSRGLWRHTLAAYEIGWDSSRKCYTIPVRDADGTLINVRRYQPRPPPGRRKMWGVEGYNGAHLFPLSSLDGEGPIIIGEGEWDMLVTTQYGFPAVTRTASAITWKREWNHLFEGRDVYLCHDMDKAGQEANRKVGLALTGVAASVRVIRLPYPLREKDGQDLTDYWLDHDGDPDEFRRLIEEAREFDAAVEEEDPEEVGPSEAAVLDAFDARRVGRPLRLTTTIKGKREPGHSIPRKAHYTCSQDAGEKCERCPLNKSEGEAHHVIPGGDPIVLELIDVTRPQLVNALRRFARIPECQRLSVEVEEFQAVEQLYARPSIDHMNGQGAGEHKNIKITSVGRHDTLPNNTVQVVGALYPDPKTQLNAFLAWDVARMETSLDRFDIDGDMAAELRRFRPAAGQRPLKKVREIADDLARNITFIYGRPELHALIDLVYHSALSFNFDGKRIHRGWLEALIVGDSRTGKSEVATRLSRHYRAGEVVLCEGASIAGIVGGLQQFGASKEWAITWGAIPLNDRRLVVLDEVSGLPVEDIGKLSGLRSSGVAEIQKVQQERTYARTRLIWLGNPRNARMSEFTYGVQAIRPLIGNNEDIARFDLAMSVASHEVPSEQINREYEAGETSYPSDACAALVRWAWSRTADQIRFDPRAEREVYRASILLGRRYTEDPPLIQEANAREKVARLAIAIAQRTFSTDETYERVIVRRDHVRDAVAFIDLLYGMKGFGYRERSSEAISDRRDAERKATEVRAFLRNKPWLAKFLRSNGRFRRQDLEEIGNMDREEANAIINALYEARMIVKDKGDIKLTPTLHTILREGR